MPYVRGISCICNETQHWGLDAGNGLCIQDYDGVPLSNILVRHKAEVADFIEHIKDRVPMVMIPSMVDLFLHQIQESENANNFTT